MTTLLQFSPLKRRTLMFFLASYLIARQFDLNRIEYKDLGLFFWHILSQKAVGIFIGSSLPG